MEATITRPECEAVQRGLSSQLESLKEGQLRLLCLLEDNGGPGLSTRVTVLEQAGKNHARFGRLWRDWITVAAVCLSAACAVYAATS